MTTKKIVFGDGTSAHMTYEQILEQFEQLINKFTYQTVNVCERNKLEFDDVKQEMNIAAWKAFNKYNIEIGCSFSTYIFNWLRHAKSKIITAETAQKKTAMSEFSMNNSTGENEEKEFMYYLEDESANFEDVEFLSNCTFIADRLNSKEREMFYYLMVEEGSGENYAKQKGVSRQAINKQLIKLRKKIQSIVSDGDMIVGTAWEEKLKK